MAVVQISRIQVRRGKANSGTGFPQLASGELGWAIDNQELYIGNGSVAEGSPAVGNTKILTQRDLGVNGNILNLLQTVYKANDDSIQTGPSVNEPVQRSLQDRLDDVVTVADFIHQTDIDSGDYTEALQRAIDQLFLNPTTPSYANTDDGVKTRVILVLPPGNFPITSTIYIPSYTTLVGSGAGKTVIQYTGTGEMIRFVNDTSTPGVPSTLSSTTGNTQPRYISIKGITFETLTSDQTGLTLDAVQDSLFEDIEVNGNWGETYNAGSKGIVMNALSDIVTTERNTFKRLRISGFSYAVYAKQDILSNTFNDCYFTDVRQGFVLGAGANGTTVGEKYGPRNTVINNCRFDNIKRQAVYIDLGSGNVVEDCYITDVGNNGGSHITAQYPQIYFHSHGNSVSNVYSDRSDVLSNSGTNLSKVQLTLSSNVTASKGDYVLQSVSTSATGLSGNSNIVVVSPTGITAGMDVSGTGIGTNAKVLTVIGNNVTLTVVNAGAVSGTIVFTGGRGYLIDNVIGSNVITLTNLSVQLFDTTNNLTINGDTTPSTSNGAVHPTVVGSVVTIPYVPEVSGHGSYSSHGTRTVRIGQITNATTSFRLPVSTDDLGDPTGCISYRVEYVFQSESNYYSRRGTLYIVADVENGYHQLSDEYDFAGNDPTNTISLQLNFSVRLLDATGAEYVGGVGQVPYSIAVRHTDTLDSDVGYLIYSYSSTF